MHSVTILFRKVKGSMVSKDLFTQLLFEHFWARFNKFLGQVVTSSGWKINLKVMIFEKWINFSSETQGFISFGGNLGIQLNPKKLNRTSLTSYLRHGSLWIFQKVPRDQNFWFLEFLKIYRNFFVLWNFLLCHSKKSSLKVPTNQNCDSVLCLALRLKRWKVLKIPL